MPGILWQIVWHCQTRARLMSAVHGPRTKAGALRDDHQGHHGCTGAAVAAVAAVADTGREAIEGKRCLDTGPQTSTGPASCAGRQPAPTIAAISVSVKERVSWSRSTMGCTIRAALAKKRPLSWQYGVERLTPPRGMVPTLPLPRNRSRKRMREAKPEACPVQEKFAAARKELSAALIERDEEVDLVLTALVANEHVLLVGPPGTAKSLLLDSLTRWLEGRRFAILLTKFTTVEEVFGPVSLKGLKEDRFVRVTAGRLPEADLAFLDEVFKASSAILNTLLKVLNERLFDPGDGAAGKVPLRVCVAASNEYPQAFEGGKELCAAFDRFLLRK